jgi:hypothetical protein
MQKLRLEPRKGFMNRHVSGLPYQEATITIAATDVDGEHMYTCKWFPFDKGSYTKDNMPTDGYLGTARVIVGPYTGIGFHAWRQSDNEFTYYKIIKL